MQLDLNAPNLSRVALTWLDGKILRVAWDTLGWEAWTGNIGPCLMTGTRGLECWDWSRKQLGIGTRYERLEDVDQEVQDSIALQLNMRTKGWTDLITSTNVQVFT
jgi:hypothetical protein